jgi:ribonuclease HII
MKKSNLIVGIDEAGRGPLAGGVFVAAVLFYKNPRKILEKLSAPAKLADSKDLSEKKREEWFEWIKRSKIPFFVASVSPKVIDKINITRAANIAAKRALAKMIDRLKLKKIEVVADAGISIGFFKEVVSFKSFPDADKTVAAVSLASIVAKVKRDTQMKKLDKKYPYYGFLSHKGYGTKKHIQAIKKFGPSPIHRLTFIKGLNKM